MLDNLDGCWICACADSSRARVVAHAVNGRPPLRALEGHNLIDLAADMGDGGPDGVCDLVMLRP